MNIRRLILPIFLFSAAAAASDTASVKTIEADLIGKPPSGAYGVIIEHDASLATHTIYRPAKLGAIKHPVMAWANGACKKSGLFFAEFLAEIASHGIVIIADGPPIPEKRTPPEQRPEPTPRPSPSSLKLDGTPLIAALDWIEARN